MYDIKKRKVFRTVGELKEILKNIPDETVCCVGGLVDPYMHVSFDDSVITFDDDPLDELYA